MPLALLLGAPRGRDADPRTNQGTNVHQCGVAARLTSFLLTLASHGINVQAHGPLPEMRYGVVMVQWEHPCGSQWSPLVPSEAIPQCSILTLSLCCPADAVLGPPAFYLDAALPQEDPRQLSALQPPPLPFPL